MPGCRFAYALVSNEADDEEMEQGPNKNFSKYCSDSQVRVVQNETVSFTTVLFACVM